jgi:hypothetical protein
LRVVGAEPDGEIPLARELATRGLVARSLEKSIRRDAEIKSAPVVVKDAILRLSDRIDELAESGQRQTRMMLVIAGATLALTAAILVLTALLVLR